ncbi:hypothetical protein [Nannocystis pusilla]|uniref:hypothetical protein n=1 Tax=Nannocystis pusilla TaxID=889268 RepID=UPI003B7DC9C9
MGIREEPPGRRRRLLQRDRIGTQFNTSKEESMNLEPMNCLWAIMAIFPIACDDPEFEDDSAAASVIDEGAAAWEVNERASSFEVTFSALPYSFDGVSDCEDNSRLEKEAQAACLAKAKQSYGDMASISFVQGPDWHAEITSGDVCQQYVFGACVDWARECNATFDRLNCTMRITFPGP